MLSPETLIFTDPATEQDLDLGIVGWTPDLRPKPWKAILGDYHTTPNLDEKANQAATSEFSSHPSPTQAEAKDGSYPKGRITLQGIQIVIENPRGSVRSGVTREGKPWSNVLAHHYGFIKGVWGADGDGIDCFIGPDHDSENVYIVHQVDPSTRAYDEAKVMLGFEDEAAARAGYLASYSKGWKGIGSIQACSMEDFKDWLDWGGSQRPITKAGFAEAEPDGGRWLTVHPGGPGSEGHPIKVMPINGTKGAYRVIGGAGGKMNGLRLQGLKDPATYQAESRERKAQQRAEAKDARSKMSPEERAGAKQQKLAERAKRKEDEEKFIHTVLGHGEQDKEQPELPTAPPAADEDPKVAQQIHRERLAQAHAAVKEAEKKLLLDAEARSQAGMDTIGGADSPLSVDDLLDETSQKGPGYRRELAARAEQAGLTADKLMETVSQIRERAGKGPKTPEGKPIPEQEDIEANREAHKAVVQLQTHKAAALREAAKAAIKQNPDLAKAIEARKVLREAYKASINDKRPTFEPGFQMAVSNEGDTKGVEQSLYDQLLTGHVVNFLREVGEAYPEGEAPDAFNPVDMEGMHASRGGGAFDALHEIGLAAVGQGMIERDVVEALGPEGAAQVLARGIRREFTLDDQDAVLQALENHHLGEQEKLPEVVEEAQRLRGEANEIQADLASNPRDLSTAIEMQKNRLAALKDARRTLGGTLGRMEARAALIAALRSPDPNTLTLPLGKMSPEKAVQTAAALGLQDGDYRIDHEDGEAVIHLEGKGIDRLVQPVDQAQVAERELALAIKGGQLDQAGYLPAGFADRTASRYDNPVMEPYELRNRLKIPADASPDGINGAIEEHVGLRVADGERPGDILSDLFSATSLNNIPAEHQAEYLKQVQAVFPLQEVVRDEKGEPVWEVDQNGQQIKDTHGNLIPKTKMRPADSLLPQFQAMAEKTLAAKGMGPETALHAQMVNADHPDFHEAIHRAIAADPRLRAAYIPQAELTHDQGAAVRDFFYRDVAKKEPGTAKGKQADLQAALDGVGPEPPKFDEADGGGLFAEMDMDPVESPIWTQWSQRRQAVLEQHAASASTPWADYVTSMGGLVKAQAAVQDVMRSKLNEGFQEHYKRLTGQGLRVGKTGISHAETYLQATGTPEEQEALRKRKAGEIDSLRERNLSGQYGAGSVTDKLEAARQAKAAQGQAQASLFGDDEDAAPAEAEETPKVAETPTLASGERLTLGTTLEAQLRAAMPGHAQSFEGQSKPVNIHEGVRMDGKYVLQQRAIKAITKLKRIGLYLSPGAGKTNVMLGSLSQLHHDGKVRKSILAVPSIVQSQFGAEAIRYIDPNSGFHVHSNPGESYEARLAAYADPDKHAVVVTHQTLRDDTLKMLAEHRGTDEAATRDWVLQADPEELAGEVKAAIGKHGINPQALMVDEAHGALDRIGKEDSAFSKIIRAYSHNAEYVVGATGNPTKNSTDEAWSDLNFLDPHKYPRESRDEFMRRFGNDAELSKKSLAQQLTRYWYNGKVETGVDAHKVEDNIPITGSQKAAVDQIELASGKLRTGTEDVEKWARVLAPEAFSQRPNEDPVQVAAMIQKSVGTFRESAMNRAINLDPNGGKMQRAVVIAKEAKAENKPSVMFCRNLEAVAALHKNLEAAGMKVISLTGKDSSKEKGEKVAAYQRGEYDVIVMSESGSVGANIQRGKVLVNLDQGMTSMQMEQRQARIDRLGQTQDVEIHHLLADTPWEKANLDRVKRKAMLGEIFQSPEGMLDDKGLAGELREIRSRHNQAEAA